MSRASRNKFNWISLTLATLWGLSLVFLSGAIIADKGGKKFFDKKFPEHSQGLIEIRLKTIEVSGNETFVNAKLYSQFPVSSNPGKVFLRLKDPLHFPGLYALEGNYSATDRVFEGEVSIPFYPSSGSRSNFPFDNLAFDLEIGTKPESSVREFNLYQEIKGFRIAKSPNPVYQNGMLTITFDLKRYWYSKLAFLVLAIFVVFYLILAVCRSEGGELLLGSLFAFFVGVW
jgi:hypothetical protein